MRTGWATLFDVRRISGQLALLIVVSVLVSHLVLTGFFMLRRPPSGEGGGRAVFERAVTLVRLLDDTPDAGRRAELMEAANRTFPKLQMARGQGGDASSTPGRNLQGGPGDFARRYRLVELAPPSHDLVRARATLSDGSTIDLTVPAPDSPPEFSGFIVGTLGATAISLVILLVWAARVLTSPLTRFADVAERFSLEGDPVLLPETGPREVRTASRAFNRMQARIRQMMDGRTRMLASVGHDLRTPITRLRLRAEFIADEGARAAILRDLESMNAMVHGALSYLRDGQVAGVAGKLDLAALLRTVADEFADLGHPVTYEGPDHQVVTGRADDLQRAVSNLVENATKYGTRSEVRLAVGRDAVEVEVSDDGPGIPAEQRDAMLEPFARGDEARTGVGGFGLGLSIVRAVAEGHGGRLTLLGREPHGLTARLTLPLSPAAA